MTSDALQLPRVALIGVSGYGRIHLQLLRECVARREVRLTAAAVINPEEEATVVAELRGMGCTVYSSYESMLEQERGRLDLCMIPTGIHWHARMTLDALRAGANVLVEKPLAATLADVEAIRQATQETGRFVAVGFQDYYESGTQWLKEQVHAGGIGRLESVRVLGIWPRPRGYYLRNNWAGRLQINDQMVLDSPLNNAFAHFVMLALYFAGAGRDEAATVKIESAELGRAHPIETFDTAVVQARTPGDVDIWLGVSHCCRPQFGPEIRLTGTTGIAGWDYETEAWMENAAGRKSRVVADITGARREMMTAVLSRLRDPAARICTPEIARKHTEFIVGLHAGACISTVETERIDWTAAESSPDALPMVQGLEEAMHQAHARQSRLEEVGFSLTPCSPRP